MKPFHPAKTIILIFLFFITLCCVFIIRCTGNGRNALEMVDFISNPGIEISKLSDIADEVQYTVVRIPDSIPVPFGAYTGFTSSKSGFFLSTYKHDILGFDHAGNLCSYIPRAGISYNGYLRCFDVDDKGNAIAVAAQEKILLYKKTSDGYALDTTLMYSVYPNSSTECEICPDFPTRMSIVPGEEAMVLSFFQQGAAPLRDLYISFDGEIIDSRPNQYKYKKSDKMGFGQNGDVIHYKYRDVVFFKEMFSDIVYTIDSLNQISPAYIIDCHGKQRSKRLLAKLSEKRKPKIKDCFSIWKLFETDRYLIARVDYKDIRSQFYVYDKSERKYANFSAYQPLIDDISGGFGFYPDYSDGEYLYAVKRIDESKELMDSYSDSLQVNTPFNQILKQVRTEVADTESRVMIICRVKPKQKS